jgi:hypothetical protein
MRKKATTYNVGNSGPGLRQSQICGYRNPHLPFLITGSAMPMAINIYNQMIENLHRLRNPWFSSFIVISKYLSKKS